MVKLEKVRQELIDKLNEKFEVDADPWDSAIKIRGPNSTRFMEDEVRIIALDKLTEREQFDGKELEAIRQWAKDKNGIINIDLWNKDCTKLTPALFLFLRQTIDDFATRHNLLKVFNWGTDDGGIVILVNKRAVFRTYWARGTLEIDTFGPDTEDCFWATYGTKPDQEA